MPVFDIFASPRWSPLRMRTKVASFFIFFQELSNKKKIKALRPKMTKIASSLNSSVSATHQSCNQHVQLNFIVWQTHLDFVSCAISIKAGPPPLEAILVIFGCRALIFFFVRKLLEKNEKWHHFCAHAQWWSPWRRKNVEKGHLAPSNLTFYKLR